MTAYSNDLHTPYVFIEISTKRIADLLAEHSVTAAHDQYGQKIRVQSDSGPDFFPVINMAVFPANRNTGYLNLRKVSSMASEWNLPMTVTGFTRP